MHCVVGFIRQNIIHKKDIYIKYFLSSKYYNVSEGSCDTEAENVAFP